MGEEFAVSEDVTTPGPNAAVSLREITAETVRQICALSVAPEQQRFVESNAVSIAEAHFSPVAWFRAIYADETPIGFLMLYDDDSAPEYFLWRLMVAAEHQGKGYGKRALEQLIEYVMRRPNATELLVGYVPGDGSPGNFYRRLGFEDTGRTEGGEIILRLPLTK